MKPRDISYLKINDIHEYNLPYPQAAFTHNMTFLFIFVLFTIQQQI